MDPIFKFPASPGTPLFPVSPERANRQQLPQSPSMPSIAQAQHDPFMTHSRGTSDVQGKVAQFNSLSKEAARRRKDNEAALKRAMLGREEAESETRRLREENGLLRIEVEEGRARERRVGERMESVMEELQRAKETHSHSQTIHEKEVRRARKEAFKSSSALVKMQEELKSARNKYTLMREEVDVQRRKVDAKERETLAAQNMLVDLQEEVDRAKQQVKVVEGQREALKTALKGEEIARLAAEGAVGLPACPDGDEFASPEKVNRKQRRESLKENLDPEALEIEDELLILKEELRMEKRMRLQAVDQVHFMKMECQFQCCSCRVAEKQGVGYVHDGSLADQMSSMAAKIVEEYVPALDEPDEDNSRPSTPPPRDPSEHREPSEPPLSFSPSTGTFHTQTSPEKSIIPEAPSEHSQALTPAHSPSPPSQQRQPSQEPTSPPHSASTLLTLPQTPLPRSLPHPPPLPRTISHTTTTTTTIPLKTDDIPPAPMTPGGISRAEALEQIRQRRGRARSIAAGNGTPRRRMVDVVGELRRDISAPAGGGGRDEGMRG